MPPVNALASNKLQGTFGSGMATFMLLRRRRFAGTLAGLRRPFLWSLGGSAVWPLTTPERAAELGLAGAVAFYPVVEDATQTPPAVPVLVLTGAADDVTELGPIRELVDRYRTLGSDIELVTYPGAHHGFDIASLKKPRTVRLIPFIGPKATFGHDADAAADAWERVAAAVAAWIH